MACVSDGSDKLRNGVALPRFDSGNGTVLAGFPTTNGVMLAGSILGRLGTASAWPCAFTVVLWGMDAIRTTVLPSAGSNVFGTTAQMPGSRRMPPLASETCCR